MLTADDYGRLEADEDILRAELYPLELGRVSGSDLSSWLLECESAGLIRFYEAEGKRCLEIYNYRQRLKWKKSRAPKPAEAQAELDLPEDDPPPKRGEERRREERRGTSEQSSDEGAKPASLIYCIQFFERQLRLPKAEAEAFYYHYDATGWKIGRTKIKKWTSVAKRWAMTHQERGGDLLPEERPARKRLPEPQNWRSIAAVLYVGPSWEQYSWQDLARHHPDVADELANHTDAIYKERESA